ncbi:MAG TPA: alpha/beta family hydrolase [Drouetiella sp.]
MVKEREIQIGGGLSGTVNGGGKRGLVIISHGAGRGLDAPILVKTAERLADLGFQVVRFNFSYLGVRPAPSAGGKKEQPELVSVIEHMKQYGAPILIGKSFGARVGTFVAAERDDIRALVFYGLPIQGMGKNPKPRDWSHLGKIKAPMLFITGHNDKLCPLSQLVEEQKHITGKFASQVVPGDHSFKPKGEDAAIELCVNWVDALP